MHSEDSGNGTSRRERERQKCREAILDAAVEAFGRQGYQKTSMKDIAEHADMSVGKLYSCFAGKEEIYRSLLEKYMGEMHRRGDEACRGGDPPLEQLRCRLAAVIEHFKEHVSFFMIYHNESPRAFEGAIRHEIERHRETAAELFSLAIERGEMRRVDPNVLSAVFVGAVHELLHVLADLGDIRRFDDVPGIIESLIIEPLLMAGAREKGLNQC
jgi:TetR/AcrR family transcriptional regulator